MAFVVTNSAFPQRRAAGLRQRHQARFATSRRPVFLKNAGLRGLYGMGNCSDASTVSQITAAANRYGVPPSIALAVARQESNCSQSAKHNNSNGTVDIGMFQLNSSTFPNAASMSQAANIDQGVSYLAQMYAKFGNWPDALAAYNGGPGFMTTGTGRTRNADASLYAANVYNSAVNNYGFVDAPASGTGDATTASVPVSTDTPGNFVADVTSEVGSVTSGISPAMWAGIAAAAALVLSEVMG